MGHPLTPDLGQDDPRTHRAIRWKTSGEVSGIGQREQRLDITPQSPGQQEAETSGRDLSASLNGNERLPADPHLLRQRLLRQPRACPMGPEVAEKIRHCH